MDRRIWGWIGAGLLFGTLALVTEQLSATAPESAPSLPGPCAPTPAAALMALRNGLLPGNTTGYRVEAVRWDSLRQQRWAVIGSCDHPERPAMTQPAEALRPFRPAVPGQVSAALGNVALQADLGVLLVHAGDAVRLWKMDARTHIELAGTAEENGSLGSHVRIRLPAPKDAEGQINGPPQYLTGVVRGAADVEMEP